MPRVTVLLFAILKDKIGIPRLELDLLEGGNVKDLKSKLTDLYPQAGPVLATTLVSINHEFAFDDDLIPADAEIGLFPPVSGGMDPITIVRITDELIDLNDLLAQITNPHDGAACIFTGMVRGVTTRGNAHITDVLFYEAYTEMAEAKMRQVASEIRSRWPDVDGIAVIQRVGRARAYYPHNYDRLYSSTPGYWCFRGGALWD